MNNKRLLFLTLIVATLTIGVIIGSIVSGGVKATFEQKPPTLALPDPVALSNAFSQIAAQVGPAVVNINVEATIPTAVRGQRRGQGAQPQDPFDFFRFFGGAPDDSNGGRPPRSEGTGTGFIVDKTGFIVTNNHVVENADKITVRLLDKTEHAAKLVGTDPETDLAVIKIDAGRELETARFGNSDAVKVGDWVLAIGSPFGFDHTVTAGIISAKGRSSLDDDPNVTNRDFKNFLQTDAAINPGNSGGPLVNMAGEVIGVNTAIISQTNQFAGLGFALPSGIALRVYNQLAQNGKVTRGSIGITYSSGDAQSKLRAFGLKDGEGVIVEDVIPNLPAAKAGLRAGDVITEIAGRKISGGTDLLDVVANSTVGAAVQLKFLRDGRPETVQVTIADRAELPATAASGVSPGRDRPANPSGTNAKLGFGVEAITPEILRDRGLSNTQGVIVTSVDPDSPAEDAGLTAGMVINEMRVNGRVTPILNLGDFNRTQAALMSHDAVAFRILVRDANNRYQTRFLSVTVP